MRDRLPWGKEERGDEAKSAPGTRWILLYVQNRIGTVAHIQTVPTTSGMAQLQSMLFALTRYHERAHDEAPARQSTAAAYVR